MSANVVWPGARTPPTEFLNSVSPVKTSAVDVERDHPGVWPGVGSALTRQRADLQLARRSSPGRPVDRLVGAHEHLEARPARRELAELLT